jgi:hypothetical protein
MYNNNILYMSHIRENETTLTFKNYTITRIYPCRRKDCANNSLGRVGVPTRKMRSNRL